MTYPYNDPVGCAENDHSRSRYVRNLVQTSHTASTTPSVIRSHIPKVIVQFWDNLTEIPKDVQECLDTWKQLETQGFERVVFDDRKARDFITTAFSPSYVEAFDLCYHPAMRCDYFRLCYILSNGGFYVDADEIYQGTDCSALFDDDRLKIQPLCYDIQTGEMIKPEVFMIDRKYSSNWIFYINNNPLISPAGHPVIRLALKRTTRILLNIKERPEIQSTTGPGNLTASLVRHAISLRLADKFQDFFILPDWEAMSISPWSLSYRNDERNWRLSKVNAVRDL